MKEATKKIRKAAEGIAYNVNMQYESNKLGMEDMATSYFMQYMSGLEVLDILTGARWDCFITTRGTCRFFDCSDKYESFEVEL